MNSRRSRQRGVTLLEIMIVVTIAGLMVGVAFPSVTSGLDTLRLRSASDSIVSTLNSALNRADRRLTAMEIRVDKAAGKIVVAGAEPGYVKELELPEGITIERVLPPIPNADEEAPRQFLIHPGSTVPRIGIQLKNRRDVRRVVLVDPITGVAQVMAVE